MTTNASSENRTQLLRELGSDPLIGLTQVQVDAHRSRYGPNELVEGKRKSFVLRIAEHLKDITSMVLLFAVALSAYLTVTGDGNWTKTVVIALIVVLNVAISMLQEGKAEKALAGLQSMTSHQVEVLRDGLRQQIDAKEVVPGDVMLVKSGNALAADGILLEASDLMVEEAILTGESEAVEKEALSATAQIDPSGAGISPKMVEAEAGAEEDRSTDESTVYSGTSIIQGTGKVVVTATGMHTEMGKIADMLNTTEKLTTPLTQRLNSLAVRLSVVAVLGGIISILLATVFYGDSLAESMMVGIGLAIAAVPESLPVIVTLSLAYGVRQMAKKNAIVRQITAVETIGGVTVIASDKTGTLTQNLMTVTQFWSAEGSSTKVGSEPISALQQSDIFDLWALASTAELGKEGHPDSGTPTELAILRFVNNQAVMAQEVLTRYPQLDEDPFNSEKKSMATFHEHEGRYVAVIKGAFDRLHFADPDVVAGMKRVHDEMAADGLRVLAGGYQWFDQHPGPTWAQHLDALEPLGLMGIQDPPRKEVPAAIAEAHRAGIRTVMITGDHVETARAIAKDIGILQADELVLSGAQLDQMSDEDLEKVIDDVRVFARTTPSDKLRIVKTWQKRGEVVAMTGDGVNDAPALRQADVGIAMGIAGTDVSKSAADMILVDDNFATIIAAVRQGRTVYQNIVKAVEFLVSVNFAQIFTMLISVAIGWGAPLSAEQMLIINILADGIPGFFLSQERAEPGIMNLAPVKRGSSIWQGGLGKRVFVRTSTYVALILGVYAYGRFALTDGDASKGMSMLFFVLAIGSVLDVFPIKSRQKLRLKDFTSNPVLTRSIVCTIAALFIVGLVPALASIFGVVALSAQAWPVVIIASLIPAFVVEGYKRIQHRNELSDWVSAAS